MQSVYSGSPRSGPLVAGGVEWELAWMSCSAMQYITCKSGVFEINSFNNALLDMSSCQYTENPVFALGSILSNIAPREFMVKERGKGKISPSSITL